MSDQEQSAEDQINWYKQQLGKQGNEIGELRKIVDEYITKDNAPTPERFEEDPVGTMERQIQQAVKPIQDKLAAQEVSAAKQRLAEAHPDYEQVVQDGNFQEWVNSSRVHKAAFERAVEGDLDVGIDLISEYKNTQGPTQTALNTALGSNRGASSETGTRESTVYKRADIIRKKIEDPAWYRDHQDEIMAAYAEGRVR